MKNKRIMLTSIVLAGLIGLVGFGYVIQRSPQAFLAFAVGSQPDGYGNYIWNAIIYQNRGGVLWSTSIQYYLYESGMSVNINANSPTWIASLIIISKTLCPGGQSQAKDVTRVYLSVSGVKTNELMSWVSTAEGPTGFWMVLFNSTSWTPQTSVTYTVTLNYQAYY